MKEELKEKIIYLEQKYIDAFSGNAPRDKLQKLRDDIRALEERLYLITQSEVSKEHNL